MNFRLALVIFAVVLMIIAGCRNNNRSEQVNLKVFLPSKITKVIVVEGWSGKRYEIVATQEIEKFLMHFDFPLKKIPKCEPWAGYHYRIELYNENELTLSVMTFGENDIGTNKDENNYEFAIESKFNEKIKEFMSAVSK